MPRPRNPALRQRLLEAGARRFAASGYAETTLEEIASDAGVTKGGFYLHFASKEDLFFAAVDQSRQGLREALQALPNAATAATRLVALVRAYLTFQFQNPHAVALLRVVATELKDRFTTQVREDARAVHRLLRQQLRETLAEGINDGSLFAEDSAFAAFVLGAALEGIVGQWLQAPREAEAFCDPDQLSRALVAPYVTGRRARQAKPVGGDSDAPFLPPF